MNITRTSELYVSERPGIKNCLKKGLVNYSALARTIIKDSELKKDNFDAVIVALRRFKEKLSVEQKTESMIRKVLKQSTIEIHNKIVVLIITKSHYFETIEPLQKKAKRMNKTFRVIEGVNEATIITTEEYLKELEDAFKYKLKKTTTDLIEIIIRSPDSLEDVPGVMAYIYSLMAENQINIVETMSCWTDTILVIDKKDLSKASELLSF